MKVLVIGSNGLGLMPTTERKARLLLKEHKAVRVRKISYTIRLLYKTGSATQQPDFGMDTGSQHIGTATTSESGAVIDSAEYGLRSTMEKRKLLETRKTYRRGRRYRKRRYRHPKFRGHAVRRYVDKRVKRNGHLTHWKKKVSGFTSNRAEGWLPPSMQSKCDMHMMIMDRYREGLPPKTRCHAEVGRFDIARMKDPEIHGELYQLGRLYDYENIRAYVFDRDGYKCRVCKKRAGSRREDGSIVKLHAHHVDFKSKAATDNPDRMASVCDRCHSDAAHKPGGILYDWMLKGKKFSRGYRDATFMNILRKRMQKAYPDISFTYGNITKADREFMGLGKSHAADAIAIAAGHRKVTGTEEPAYYQQVRSRKRSLHEAKPRKGRKEPNREAKRNAKNTVFVEVDGHTYFVYDKVSLNGQTGWISGFTGISAYVRDRDNEFILLDGKTYNQMPLSQMRGLSHNHNWLIGARKPIGKD